MSKRFKKNSFIRFITKMDYLESAKGKPKISSSVSLPQLMTGEKSTFVPTAVPTSEISGSSRTDQEVDHQRAIKVYSRSSADQGEPLSHELRTGNRLEMTLDYILHNDICSGESDESLADWYNFVWDRTRSIRKEITQQQLCNSQAVSLMEKCARFHIHCSSRLCELDRFSFDTKLNDENLMNCLQSLEHLYSDLRLKNVECPNEPEFRAYQILMNLNEGDILWEIQQKPSSILKSFPVQQALKIHHAVSSKNFVAFFRVVSQLPYLTSCIVHRYFFQVRSAALRTLVRSQLANPNLESWISASKIHRMLGYELEDQTPFISLCMAHGVYFDRDSKTIFISIRFFHLPVGPSIYRETHLIESKLTVSISEAINGGPLGPNPYPSQNPESSFDDEDYLIPEPIISSNPQSPSPETSSSEDDDSSSEDSVQECNDQSEDTRYSASTEAQHYLPAPKSIKSQRQEISKRKVIADSLNRLTKFVKSKERALHARIAVPSQNAVVPHSSSSSTNKRLPTKGSKKIKVQKTMSKCPVCGQEFKKNFNMKRHRLTHTRRERSFQCPTCPKKFFLRDTLKQHEISHTGEKPFPCNRCNKAYAKKGDLKRHKTVHTGKKPFKCLFCGAEFNRKVDLENHIAIHTGEAPFKCNECEQYFRCQRKLNLHKARHIKKKNLKRRSRRS